MMVSLQSYMRRGQHLLRKWSVNPRLHALARAVAHLAAGFVLSAASLGQSAMPIAMGLVCACSGWSAVLAAVGSAVGYRLFWGAAGNQGLVWTAVGLLVSLTLRDRRICRESPYLLPALGGVTVAAAGVLFQTTVGDMTTVPIYLLRVGLGIGGVWLLDAVLLRRDPILEWLTWGVAVLALAQLAPVPYLGLGFVAAGALTVSGAFPAAALAGLALDLAQVTQVPMAAVVCCGWLVRFLPRYPRWMGLLAPGALYLAVMGLCGVWDLLPLPGLLLGCLAGAFFPQPTRIAHRRGETGAAQVRLELAAGVLTQTQQLLLEVPVRPVDEPALVSRAAERACGGCPCRKNCRDVRHIAQLPAAILHKPLLTAEELPIVCRKSGRFLAELHRSQEQLRSIQADRERQREYRAAVIQQYRFLAEYLQSLSDTLCRRPETYERCYSPRVSVYGNRPEQDNGDRCAWFPGIRCLYYVLLCDGMGTGLGAVQEARTAVTLLRRLLNAGYPAEYALRSLNSLCALRERAGAVTVDLAELDLDTGRGMLYKWGAAPSYLVSRVGTEKLGTAGPPPGLSVTDRQEQSQRLSLRRGELLVLVSDGVEEETALRCCMDAGDSTPGELATRLLTCAQLSGQDDATVVTVTLESAGV